jgi:hypothetical protein
MAQGYRPQQGVSSGWGDGHGGADGFLGDHPQANNGLRTAAQIRGMLIDRREIGEPGEFARMTDAESDAALIEHSKALGLPDAAVQMLLTVRAE